MADFKVPNLCGASPEFNAIQTKFESMMTSAIDGLEVDASALKATLDTDVTSLVADLKAMIPELPALPNVNLQAQLTSLSGLSIGSGQYNTLLADLTTKFGSALTAGGFSLDTLVSDAASALTGGGNLCAAVPNFEVPAIGGDAVEKAIGVLQPALDSVKEEVSVQLANVDFTAAKTAVESTFTSYEEIGEEVPAEDIGPYRVAEETTKVAVSDNQGSVTTIEATTPKNSVGASTTVTTATTTKTETIKTSGGNVTERKRSNVAKKGFTRRTIYTKEYILLDDVGTGGVGVDYEFTLKNTPISIGSVWGYDPTARKGRGRWWYIAKASSRQTIADSYTLDGQTMEVSSDVHEYDEDSNGYMFRVRYRYMDNYDPNFAGPI
jgi:hypothetical protein